MIRVGALHHVVLLLAGEAMLRRQQRGEAHVRERADQLPDRLHTGIDAGRVRQERHASPAQSLPKRGAFGTMQQHVGAEPDRRLHRMAPADSPLTMCR